MLELPEPIVSGAVARATYAGEIDELSAHGVMAPLDTQQVAIVDDDAAGPASLNHHAEHGLGYFSATDGWVSVPPSQVERYRVDVRRVLALTVGALQRRGQSPTSALLPGLAWSAGDIILPGRSRRVAIWFARRLSDVAVVGALREAARRRSVEHERVVLTSTASAHLDGLRGGRLRVFSLHDILAATGALAVSGTTLAKLLDGRGGIGPAAELEVVGDGREVRFRGEVFRFPRGETQRRIILYLHECYEAGIDDVSTADICATLGLTPSTRMRDLFKDSPAWGRLLTERNGTVRFGAREDIG